MTAAPQNFQQRLDTLRQPKDGDFVVAQTRWETASVRKVTKISATVYYYTDDYYQRSRRARLDEIVFVGSDEAAAKRVAEQLKSSEAQYQQDCNGAASRRQKRDAEFIERASHD